MVIKPQMHKFIISFMVGFMGEVDYSYLVEHKLEIQMVILQRLM